MQKVKSKIVWLFITNIFIFGCQKVDQVKVETSPANSTKTIETPKVETPEAKLPIDVPGLVNKTEADFEKLFGKPVESGYTLGGGEYRLYKVANVPKGLAVRFYDGKAKNFNLIFDKSIPTSKEALKQVFGIDIGNIPPLKDVKEPLSEKYQGTFGGVKFSKVSAKKDEKGNGFIFVLAEVAK